MCTDFSGFTSPTWQEVGHAVAQDPMRAIAEAEALRAGIAAGQTGQEQQAMLQEQGQQYQIFGHAAQPQYYAAEDVAGPAYGRPGGSGQAGQFTTASQIQQWTAGGRQDHYSDQAQQGMAPGAGAGMSF